MSMYPSDAFPRGLGFAEITMESFDFLVSEFGFRRVLSSDTLVQYESDRVYIEVYHDPQSLEVGVVVGLLDDSTRLDQIITTVSSRAVIGRPTAEFQFTLDEIARLLHGIKPDVVLQPFVASREDAERFIPRLANALRKLGPLLLTGDRELFLLLADKRSEDAQRFTREMELSQTREKANRAWQSKQYAKVVSLLEPFRSDLTPAEAKKLEYAKEQLTG
jgi:hypothetical protein